MKSSEPKDVMVHYTKETREWLPEIVAEICEETGLRPPELYRIGFCEHFSKTHPRLAEKWGKLKKLMK